MYLPTGFMVKSEDFQISLKPLPSKVRTLFARLQLFDFYSSRTCAHLVYT